MQWSGLELSDHGTKWPDTMPYVDNLMQTGGDPLKLTEFKEESIALRVLSFLLVNGNRMWKPWEWGAKEHENMPNPSKILGHLWDKQEDTRVFCKSFPWKPSCDQTNYSKLLQSRIWSTWNYLFYYDKRKACLSTSLWWKGDIEMEKSLRIWKTM